MEYAQILPRRFRPVIIQHTLEREKSTKQFQFPTPLQEKQYKNVSNYTSTEIQFQRPENLSRISEITRRPLTYSQMDVYCNPRNLTRTCDEFSNKQMLLPYNDVNLNTKYSYSREEKCKIDRKNHITDNRDFKHVSPTNYNMHSREYFENPNFSPHTSLKFKNNYPIDKPVAYDTLVGKLPFTGDVINNTSLYTQNIHSFLTEYEENSRNLRNVVVRNSKSQQRRANICPFCNIFKTSPAQLKIHLRIHTGERPFACYQNGCEKTFARNEELTRHLRTHTGDRPYICRVCQRKFGRKDHLNKHETTHQSIHDKKVYICLVGGCTQSYTRSDALARHRWNVHLISPQLNNVRIDTFDTRNKKSE